MRLLFNYDHFEDHVLCLIEFKNIKDVAKPVF